MNRTHNPLIAMNRNERSVYSVFSDRIEAYSVIELTEIHAKEKTMMKRELENMFVKPLGSYQTINTVLLIKK